MCVPKRQVSSVLSLAAYVALGGLVLLATSCQDPQIILPASLGGPVAMAVSQGDVCLLVTTDSDTGLLSTQINICNNLVDSDDSAVRSRGAIGLLTNVNEARVSVVALDRATPSLIDLDLSTPGVNHITVGKRPVAIDTSPSGEVAYVLNELDQDVSVLNLWSLDALSERLELPGVPAALDVHDQSGQVVVGVNGAQSSLQLHTGVTCETPTMAFPLEVGEHDPDQGCTGMEESWQEFVLPAKVKELKLDPKRELAYVLYRDAAWMSVVALSDAELSAGEVCLDGSTTAPCEVDRVGLTYGCSDGLDNDGDGLADQDDPQCFSPLGAESADGVGVRVTGACADGLDNDNDGLVDRDDPACRTASQGAEGGELVPDYDTSLTACADGLDNDGDGLSDLADPDCYGAQGQSEEAIVSPGFGQLSVDEHGVLGYVTHPGNNEVLIVDLQGRRLLPARSTASVTDPFVEYLGVPISRRVAPTALDADIRRRLTLDPREEQSDLHAVINYDLGVYVTGDNGFVFYIDAMEIACEVTEDDGLMSETAFYMEPTKLADFKEANCLRLPDTFDTDHVDIAPTCEEMILCRNCIRAAGDTDAAFESCAPCNFYGDISELEQAQDVCLLESRRQENDDVLRLVNPHFAVEDAATSSTSAQEGRAQCVLPEELLAEVDQYVIDNPGASLVSGCGSPLFPQPLSTTVLTSGSSAELDYGGAQRVDLLERRDLRLVMGEDGTVTEQLVVNTEDFLVREETWTVTYEGVLPGTRRNDGIVDAEGSFNIGPLNPCLAGVQPGDHLVLLSEPGTETGGVPAACTGFETPDASSEQAWREYEVVSVYADQIVLGVLPEENGTVQEFPSPECFTRGLSYEIRVTDEWVVTGSSSGTASGMVEHDGICVPGNGGDAPRVSSRVNRGERYVGPQISFFMTEGELEPVRGMSYAMDIGRQFSSASLPSGSTFNPATPAPTQMLFQRLYDASLNDDDVVTATRQEWLIVVEPSDNVVVLQLPNEQTTPVSLR